MSTSPRPFCYRCFRPEAVCICQSLPRVDNRTEVIVLQHPRERHHPIGTARFIRLGLRRSAVRECAPRDPHRRRRIGRIPSGAALLYPSPQAREIRTLTPEERPRHLVVLDGTWEHAKKLYQANPWLAELPHLRVAPPRPSQYRIRSEPRPECVSTLEAVVYALAALEPETQGLSELLDSFGAMVDGQIACVTHRGRPRARRPQAPRPLPIPPLLRDRYRDLVLVYAEQVRPLPDQPAQPVYLTALRPADGATFAERVRAPVEAAHLRHMELDPAELAVAADPEGLARAWTDFTRPRDIIVAWKASGIGVAEPTVQLKEIYCNVIGGACGHLEGVLRREGLTPVPVAIPGRAARRLGQAAAVLEMLRGRVGQRRLPA